MDARDLANPDGHTWGAFWMDPAAMPPADQQSRGRAGRGAPTAARGAFR